MAQPEKLSLWDRLFNRYRKTIHARGTQLFGRFYGTAKIAEYEKAYVEYLVVDRLTGSETIKKEYLP